MCGVLPSLAQRGRGRGRGPAGRAEHMLLEPLLLLAVGDGVALSPSRARSTFRAPTNRRDPGRWGDGRMMERAELERTIGEAYRDRSLLERHESREAVETVVNLLDRGELRVAEKTGGAWTVNAWVKEAILLYFAMRPLEPMDAGGLHFFDKVPVKTSLAEQGIRVVPPGVARYGSFLEPGCVLMPGYVNIGAYVGSGTMVDTWATVGSCAQIGRNVHLSGGVGIGGVLEPPGATPVIVEDGCFVGSRSIVVEGVIVEEEAVLAANTVLTASTPIVDV